MDVFDPDFCFYDDPDLPEGADADKWSPLLRDAHRRLWSKHLPTGETLDLTADLTVEGPGSSRGLRLSSDTIASTHRNYRHRQIDVLWDALPAMEQRRYDRAFYAIGGFIVFPCHPNSMNQRRGTCGQIDDRFDLTLECIRLYYEGVTASDRNPLGDVLLVDSAFFDLFGRGVEGFITYVDFFCLGDLVRDGKIRWFDDVNADEWDFASSPLPSRPDTYIKYLDNVLSFVGCRNKTIAAAVAAASE